MVKEVIRTGDKTCVNCFFDDRQGDEEPCYSCIRNPQTQIEDKWLED